MPENEPTPEVAHPAPTVAAELRESARDEPAPATEDATEPSRSFAWGQQRKPIDAADEADTADEAYEIDEDEPDSLPVVKAPQPAISKTYPKSAVRPRTDTPSSPKAVSFNSDTYYKVIERLPEWADSEPTEAIDSTGIAPLGNIAPYSNTGAPCVGDEDVPIRIPERLDEILANADYVEELRAAEKAGKLEDAGYKGCAVTVANTFVNENADMDGRSDAGSMGSVDFESVGPTSPLYSAKEAQSPKSPKSPKYSQGDLPTPEDSEDDDEPESIAANLFLDYANRRASLSGPITTDALGTIAEEVMKATAIYAERMAAHTAATDLFVAAAQDSVAALEAKVASLLAANAEMKAKNGELEKENGELKIAQRMMGAFNEEKEAAAEVEREEAKARLAKAEEELERVNEEVAGLREESANLRQRLEDAELRAADMEDENAGLRHQLEEAEGKAGELQDENARLQQQIEEAEAKAAELQDENATLREQLDAAGSEGAQAAALRDDNATLRQLLDEATSKSTSHAEETTTLRDQLEAATSNATTLQTKLDKYKSAAHSLKSAGRSKDLTIAQLKREKENLETDLELALTQASLAEQRVVLLERAQKRGKRESVGRRVSVHPHASPLVPQSVNRP